MPFGETHVRGPRGHLRTLTLGRGAGPRAGGHRRRALLRRQGRGLTPATDKLSELLRLLHYIPICVPQILKFRRSDRLGLRDLGDVIVLGWMGGIRLPPPSAIHGKVNQQPLSVRRLSSSACLTAFAFYFWLVPATNGSYRPGRP